MSWEKVKLGDIAARVQTGPFGSQLHQSDYSEFGTPVVMPKDMIGGKILEDSIARVEEQHVNRLSRHKVNVGDILYARRGDVGKCALVTENEKGWLCGTGCLKVTIDFSKANPKFVFYQLQKPETVGWVEKHAVGATMLNLNTGILESIPIELPELNEQNKIVDILSAYDNLIENNQKQIKLLEEAAQRLYKQWFIDLRFPGHETTPIVDGLPEGWRKESVKDCLEMHIGGGWGKDNPDGKNTFAGKVIRGTDINDVKQGNFNDVPTRYHTANDMQKRKLAEYDIVFELSNGNINNIGRSLFVNQLLLENCGENTICASFCKLLRSKNKYLAMLLYLEIQDMQNSGRMLPYKKHGSNGINNFDFEEFLNHEFLIPSNKDLLAPFFDIMKKIANIQKSFSLLIESRDRLLPKLMNGEIFFEKGI